VAVTFTIEGGAECSFHDNSIPVLLKNGGTVLASELQLGDVFKIRGGFGDLAWSEITSEPVVS